VFFTAYFIISIYNKVLNSFHIFSKILEHTLKSLLLLVTCYRAIFLMVYSIEFHCIPIVSTQRQSISYSKQSLFFSRQKQVTIA